MPLISETILDIEREYEEKHKKSKEIYKRALNCFPSGITHDNRYEKPFPIYTTKALGTRKWDVDGNEYVDYIMGHGALLFGYGNEKINQSMKEQIEKAVHMGSCTELEVEWAELIQKLVPSARNGFVRATSCGSEAIYLAIRLARAYTGRDKVILHAGSYHGTLDLVLLAYNGPPFGIRNSKGIPESVKKDVIIVPFNDLASVEEALKKGDVACVILHCNNLYTKDYIKGLRKLTEIYGTVFIMDEVVSGLRYSKGGAQEYYGVVPDLSVLGKIVGGGAPIGAICGKKEILDYFSFKDEYWNKFVRLAMGGTWNAQPLSIVGGVTMMKMILEEGDKIYHRMYKFGRELIKSFNDLADDMKVSAFAYGLPYDDPTIVVINFFNRDPGEKMYIWKSGPRSLKDYEVKEEYSAGGLAKYINYMVTTNYGILAMHHNEQYILCSEHKDEDLIKTEEALSNSLKALKIFGAIGSK
ncbi:Glutamate-1-semialdehyde 2,1-aminomutase [archaeon HR06]|nr:Glutamate-1-semialdehyde 2,1-aminomutase [archaeon HR06]